MTQVAISDCRKIDDYKHAVLHGTATFEETAYLLLHGDLPGAAELAAFRERLAAAVVSRRLRRSHRRP